jgi:hypothetical protein
MDSLLIKKEGWLRIDWADADAAAKVLLSTGLG